MTAKVMQSDDPAITEFASSGEKYTALNILNMQKPCRGANLSAMGIAHNETAANPRLRTTKR
jgi:hypothetical protein